MRSFACASVSCWAVVLFGAASAKAMMMPPAPIAGRVATSDLVVIVKVSDFGDKLVEAEPFPGAKTKVKYQIAKCKVVDTLYGKAGKEIKVGFMPPAAGPGPGIIGKRYPTFKLDRDKEACVFLIKHPTEDFYIGQAYYDVISKTGNTNFDKDMTEVKRCAKLLADAKANLESKNADDRFLTAAMLLSRYRTNRPSATPPKQEPIDAKESKAILLALADADWDARAAAPFALTPQTTFYLVGAQPKDGWTPPRDFKEFPAAAKKWLKDNADKYRIQRFVTETKKDAK
jgi:hypothetical protein